MFLSVGVAGNAVAVHPILLSSLIIAFVSCLSWCVSASRHTSSVRPAKKTGMRTVRGDVGKENRQMVSIPVRFFSPRPFCSSSVSSSAAAVRPAVLLFGFLFCVRLLICRSPCPSIMAVFVPGINLYSCVGPCAWRSSDVVYVQAFHGVELDRWHLFVFCESFRS